MLPQDPLCKCKGFAEYAALVSQTFLSMVLSLTNSSGPVVCHGPYTLVNLLNNFADFIFPSAKAIYKVREYIKTRHVLNRQPQSINLFSESRVYHAFLEQEKGMSNL